MLIINYTYEFTISQTSHVNLERQDLSEFGAADETFTFTYVQGMNVLAAPFLYSMPSEIEAFYCFTNFIEVSCPLYVQQTLEGVHRALRVSAACSCVSQVCHLTNRIVA